VEFLKSDGVRTGLFFGATSGVITTIGLMTGLNSGTRSVAAVLGGILVIAIADALSDALGIHLAEESDPDTDHDHVWAATISTFFNKFLFAISFAVPVLLLPLDQAVIVSIIWGMLVVTVLSYFLARAQNASPVAIILEHLGIALLVVVLSHFIGAWVSRTFT
jgi:VIT1/CCC1 family predicted Fe2+/Mn2+ transporter